MKATKATNIQIRLLVEESQQLNSKKWDTKTHKSSANEMIPISNYMQKQKQKKRMNRNELKGEEQEETVDFFLTVYYSLAL